jgi:hypothetical protein
MWYNISQKGGRFMSVSFWFMFFIVQLEIIGLAWGGQCLASALRNIIRGNEAQNKLNELLIDAVTERRKNSD